jgi:aminoglycoside phosphotransferase (APT) family kinase protein
MLEQSDIAHYLLSLGLVKPRTIVEEGVSIVDASRRNRVFIVASRAGPTYVVKQAGPRSVATLAHEASVLCALARSTELADKVPAVVHHDPASAVLVLRTPGQARDFGDYHTDGRFPRSHARALGHALAQVHQLDPAAVPQAPSGTHRAWGLTLPEPTRDLLLDLSASACDLVARLQASPALCARLRAVRDDRDEERVVHGDLRWDNCLAVAAPGALRRTRVLLVDWELAGRGSAAFDVGTVLAEYLRAWVGSVPIVAPSDPGRLVAHARHPLSRIQRPIGAFWSAYVIASTVRPTLRRVIQLASVSLLQMAIERAQGLPAASAHVITLLQLADNMLQQPEAAGLSLLGLRE